MTIVAVVRDFFGTPAGTAVVVLFALAALDFALGTFAAIRDNVFRLEVVGAWLRKHIAGRVLPTAATLIIGHMLGGLEFGSATEIVSPGTIVTGIGLGMAATYVMEVIGSLRESLIAKPAPNVPETTVRTVPTD